MDRCSICPHNYNPVLPTGPQPTRYLILGERPGRTENIRGKPFVGDSGEELDQTYLPLAGIARADCRVDNVVRCWADNNKTPTEKEARGCGEHHLPTELIDTDPDVVFLMGGVACQLIGKVDLESEHGIPRWTKIFDWEGWVVPMYHPAAGMRRTELMTGMLEDWTQLKGWLANEDGYIAHMINEPKKDYRLAHRFTDIDAYFHDFYPSPVVGDKNVVGFDTELDVKEDYSVQVSAEKHTGLMAMVKDRPLIRHLSQWLNGVELILHNGPADLPFVRKMDIQNWTWRDTMQEAYQFQNLPKKLKALSRRLLGRKRLSWEETVGPASKDKLTSWLLEGLEVVKKDLTIVIPKLGKRGQKIKPEVVKSDLESKLKRIHRHTEKGGDYNPWERLDEDDSPDLQHVIRQIGPPPRMSIVHCSLEDQIYYACSDADDTLRLALMFEERRKEIVEGEWWVEPGDVDEVVNGQTT